MKKMTSASPWLSTVALCCVVLLPIGAAIAFVGVAIANQRLATQQLLGEAYRGHLANLQSQVERRFEEIRLQTKDVLRQSSGQARFREMTAIDGADSAVCWGSDPVDQYPRARDANQEGNKEALAFLDQPNWQAALQYEETGETSLAADAFHLISESTQNPTELISAVQGEVRCRLRSGEREAARHALESFFDRPVGASASEARFESLLANLELLACESIFEGAKRETILQRLANRLVRYDANSLSSDQRLFLMRQVDKLAPNMIERRRLLAEEIAAQFLAHPMIRFGTSHGSRPRSEKTGASVQSAHQTGIVQRHYDPSGRPGAIADHDSLQPTGVDGLWQWAVEPDAVELLMTTDSISRLIHQAIENVKLPKDVAVVVQTDGEVSTRSASDFEMMASSRLPGWQLSLRPSDSNAFSQVAERRSLAMICLCGLVIALTLVGGTLVVRNFHQRVRLTQLKNDLLGTVSHELRTPLSSIRLLVDTLIGEPFDNEPVLDVKRTREYLHLIRGENERLSRLIENFLTFSRHESGDNRQAFSLVSVDRWIQAAVDACRPKIDGQSTLLSIGIDCEIPDVRGDEDALVTVLVNLLDNAMKYCGASAQAIEIRAVAHEDGVSVSVSDRGIGISRLHQRNLFDRFFQVDQSLHRSERGCGLGLSIVRTIIEHHGGRVSVESELGEGSTFTVWLPAARTAERREKDDPDERPDNFARMIVEVARR